MTTQETYDQIAKCSECGEIIENGVIMNSKAYCMTCSMTPERMQDAVNAMVSRLTPKG